MKQLRSGGESWSGWTLTRWRRSSLLMKLKSSEMPLRSVFIFAFEIGWEVETILKTKGSHRCLTKMETDGSVWLSWARWWQTLEKRFPLRSTKFWSLKFYLWLDGYIGENRRKASSPKSLSILTAGARRYSGGAWCRPEWGNRFCGVSSIYDRVSYIWLYLINQLFVFNFGNKTAKAETAT